MHSLLTTYCSDCHASDAEFAQSPFFGSADINESYEASKSKLNLDLPAESRFVVRLRNEFHNCWGDCAANANQMQSAIEAFAGGIQADTVDEDLVEEQVTR